MPVVRVEAKRFDIEVPVVVIGGGACGLVAALAARDAGAEVLVLERDATPSGSTSLSSGFIPACNTRWQRERGIEDSIALMAADIARKNHGEADARSVEAICAASGPTLEWLADRNGVPFVLLDGFLYPGHSVQRMHAVPEKTGAALLATLLRAASKAGVDILASAHVTDLYADRDSRVLGVRVERPDGTSEDIGCTALILACNGFGGHREMVAKHIPEMASGQYFGHVGNQGDAVIWGEALGAAVADMSAYQGHGSVATPHGILITWALMMEGGIQVNAYGKRFSNEHLGYSEQAVAVLAQPGGVAWNIYDERLHRLGLEFEDYRNAVKAGAVRHGTPAEIATMTGLPHGVLAETLDEIAESAAGRRVDRFGRDFAGRPALRSPYYAVKVTGALFHTQGGLVIDTHARVLRSDGAPLPNLFAGGGAARGISGAHVWGYLSGNGLLTAVTLGRLAGHAAAECAAG